MLSSGRDTKSSQHSLFLVRSSNQFYPLLVFRDYGDRYHQYHPTQSSLPIQRSPYHRFDRIRSQRRPLHHFYTRVRHRILQKINNELICIGFFAMNRTIIRYVIWRGIWTLMINNNVQSLFWGTFSMGFSTVVDGVVLFAVPAFGERSVNSWGD